jgi:LysR family transcriptional regulator, regulator for bpeEF and oprC
MDRFLLMTCFVRAVETGSFSAVARELGIGQPNVSRHVAALESHLSTRLLHRSTRKLSLTPEGERFYSEARRVLDALGEAESNARGEDQPSGLLRVGCPTSLGRTQILPRIKPFLQRYPQMQIDLQISDRYIDLVEEGVDLALRIGPLADSALKATRIGTSIRVLVASPDYLERHPAPQRPEDLRHHNCIVYSLSQLGSNWRFRDGEVTVGGNFKVNTPDGIYSAVTDGLGIAYAPLWLVEDALMTGKVCLLLQEFMGPPAPISLVHSANRLLPRRARVFMEYITEEFAKIPALQLDNIQLQQWAVLQHPVVGQVG